MKQTSVRAFAVESSHRVASTTQQGRAHLPLFWRGPIYPYLFAVYTVLSFFTLNYWASLGLFTFLLLLILLGVYLVNLLVFLFVRTPDKRAAITFLLSIPLLIYGRLSAEVDMPHHLLPIGIFLTLVVAIFWIVKVKTFPNWLTQGITATVVFLVGWNSVVSLIRVQEHRRVSQDLAPITLKASDKPDIYFLVFDEYTGPQALKDLYGFDDSSFVDALRNQGMYVADRSTSNYFGSLNSLASELNFSYLDPLSKEAQQSSDVFLEDILKNNRTVFSLKQAGYTYYHLGSWFLSTRSNKNATQNFYASGSGDIVPTFIEHYFTDSTILRPIKDQFYPIDTRDIVDFQLQKTIELAKEQSSAPKFIFAHVLTPHEPYLRSSTCAPLSGAADRYSVPAYLAQLTCANQEILSFVEGIKANSKTAPIIIVQSDEGNELKYTPPTSAHDPLNAFKEKFSTLSAFYFPTKDYQQLYPTITSINTFPLIFNQFLGTHIPLADDKNYIFTSNATQGRSLDVTQQVTKSLNNQQ